MATLTRRWLSGAGALLLMVLQTYLSSQSMPDLPDGPWEGRDKLMHALYWGLIGGLIALAAARPGWRTAAIAVGIAVAFGVSDEWHQSYVPGRDASWLDLLADTVGAVAGAFATTWYIARRWRSSTASAASGPPSPTTSSWPSSPP